jgi:predicted AlkP superfamily phosphohydrolase/phosphomutase
VSWLKRTKREGKSKRVFVIGLDGTPYTHITRLVERGELPNIGRLFSEGDCRRMRSSIPPVSSVAWTCFATGKNPAKNNIFGFIDRVPHSYRTYIPTSKDMISLTLWEILSQQGKRVVVMNVPLSYPPRPVNGVLVGCFLTPDLAKGVYPESYYPVLKDLGYRIDIDSWVARESKDRFLEDLVATIEKRREATRYFMEKEDWDFFIIHFMDTDRLHHFLWEYWEQGDAKYAPAFLDFYRRVDRIVGELVAALDPGTELMILSDHGFTSIKKEVFLNHWLKEQGYLCFQCPAPEKLEDISSESAAFSLIPGRVYVNLKGREPGGSIEPGQPYQSLTRSLAAGLCELVEPESKERVIDRVLMRDDIYAGPAIESAPDLVCLPRDGYDLKGDLNRPVLAQKGALSGMHTYDDAFLYLRGHRIAKPDLAIVDAMPTILQLLGLPIPEDVDGKACLGD